MLWFGEKLQFFFRASEAASIDTRGFRVVSFAVRVPEVRAASAFFFFSLW